MHFSRVVFAAAAAATLALSACGGGGTDEEPIPSNKAGVLTVRSASVASLNGVYGDGNLNLTDVERINPIGPTPELCSFKFDGATKVGSAATAFGDLRYESGGDALYVLYLTLDGKEYTSDETTDTVVRRDLDQVLLSGKLLRASDDSGATIKVDAVIPMRGNRPAGC